MSQDRIAHFYAVYDLLHLPEKARTWIALSGKRIVGYLIEFDKRILYMRGDVEAVVPLLGNTDLLTPLFNIDAHCLSAVKKLFKVCAPADKMTKGETTCFTPMMATMKTYKSIVKHSVQELSKRDVEPLASLLGTDLRTALDLLGGYAFWCFRRWQADFVCCFA